MKQVVTKGIILARTDFGEADRIITVLTPEGKVRLMAKGVRRIKSKLAGGIELFSISYITYIPGKGDVSTLISTRLDTYFSTIVSDINRTMFGYDVLKLINRATEDLAGNEYFELLGVILAALDDKAVHTDLIQLWLYMQLLKVAGHSPNLKTDKQGQKLSQDEVYTFNIEDMTFIPQKAGRYSSQHIKLLRLAIGLDLPKQLSQVKDAGEVLPTTLQLAKTMLRQFVRI